MNLKIVISAIFLYTAANNSSVLAVEKGPFQVGFSSYKIHDSSRTYLNGKDTISRPLLVHFWYPAPEKCEGQALTFRHYIDLIAERDDFSKSQADINNETYYYIKGYSDYAKQNFGLDTSIGVQQILDSPVSAKSGMPLPTTEPRFPLIIYAPSNGKVSVQNHSLCEYLASHGFLILSVASAGPTSRNRENMPKSTIAQVMDMEHILNYVEDSLNIQYTGLGLFGFSSGGNAITIFQMRNKQVNAVLSMDGSQEYSYYMQLYKMKEYDLEKATVPYLSIVNNFNDYSIYPFYASNTGTEKFIFRMNYLNHYGFISYWRFFESCLPGSDLSNMSISYESMNELILAFFSKYLYDEPFLFDNRHFAEGDNEYMIEMEIDFSNITTLCNTLLDNNMDLAAKQVEANKDEFIAGRNQLNLLARMVNNKEQSIWLYQESLKYEPDSWKTYYDMAITYKNHGDITLAKNALMKAQEMNPENSEIENLLNKITKEL
jgi:tetratricopeptide (TPR) repeat protein